MNTKVAAAISVCGAVLAYEAITFYRDVTDIAGSYSTLKAFMASAGPVFGELEDPAACTAALKGHAFSMGGQVPLRYTLRSGKSPAVGDELADGYRIHTLDLRDPGILPILDPDGSGLELFFGQVVFALQRPGGPAPEPLLVPFPVLVSSDRLTVERCVDQKKHPPAKLCQAMGRTWNKKLGECT